MTKQLTITIDTNYGEYGRAETIESVIADLERIYEGVTGKVINPSGPGGGWPVVEWTGERAVMLEMLEESYGLDERDVAYYTKTGDLTINAHVADH